MTSTDLASMLASSQVLSVALCAFAMTPNRHRPKPRGLRRSTATTTMVLFVAPRPRLPARGPTHERLVYLDLAAQQLRLSRQGVEHSIDLERGVRLLARLEAIGDADPQGVRTVMTVLNGQLRPLQVRDRKIASAVPAAEKADTGNPSHVAAPFAGVATLAVSEGDSVEVGQTVATIEAMKMEAAITAARAGTVARLATARTQSVEGGDLLAVIS